MRRLLAVVIAALAVPSTLVVAAGASAGAGPGTGAEPALVRTSDGVIRGTVTATYRQFQGIPYAAPPVGELRWRAPEPPARWTGVRDATQPGDECPQSTRGHLVVGSEDCLFLNVTTPLPDRAGARLPVMVWIHGGGGQGGSGAQYDTTRLTTEGDVITVTINYRLGALGFLDLPQLAAEGPDAGDYALADQQAALRWVRRNAAAFGGDPRNVTLFGQSAGGYAVCANLAAPGSRGLFQKAIVESAPCGNALPSPATAWRNGTQAATALGCAGANVLDCLRGKPVADLVNVPLDSGGLGTPVGEAALGYVAGTPALPEQPLAALRDGTAARVPLIQGSNRDEMRVLVAGQYDQRGAPLTADQYPVVLAETFGPARAPEILARYPLAGYPSPDIALAAVLTDWGGVVGACPVLPADDAASRRAPVYAYEFAQDDGLVVGFPVGASHGTELPYLFGAMPNFPPPDPALSAQMIGYWTAFARTGTPNAAGGPKWTAYRPGNRMVLSLAAGADGIAPVAFATEHQCDFWQGHRLG